MKIFGNFIFYTTLVTCCIIKLSWATPVNSKSKSLNDDELERLNGVMKEKFDTINYYVNWTDEEKENYIEELKDRVSISAIDENFTTLYDYLEPNEKSIYNGIKEASKKEIPDFNFLADITYSQEVINDSTLFGTYFLKHILTGLMVFITENPEYWWFYNFSSYNITETAYDENGDIKMTIMFYLTLKSNVNINRYVGNYTPTEIRDKNLEVVRMKNNVVSRIKSLGFKTNYGIMRYIHDFFSYRNVYNGDENLDNIRTLWGALIDNNIVCEAYAEAVQLIAKEFGIECVTARSVTHEWNFVKMDDGIWYIIDLTWDDSGFMDKAFNGEESPHSLNLFLTGTDEIAYGNVLYKDEVNHLLSTNWYDTTGETDYMTYPPISDKRYVPSEEELEDVKKINESTFLFDQLPSCFANNCTLENQSIVLDGNYCIGKLDNKIYKGLGGQCELVFGKDISDEGIAVFNIESYANNTLVDISSMKDPISNPAFALYDCAYGECKQTYGYTKYNKKIYYVSTSTGTIQATSIDKCNKDNAGKLKFSKNEFQLCALEKVEFSEEGKPVFSYAFKDIEDNAYYHVTSDVIFDYVTEEDFDKYSIELLKSNNNIIVYAQINPQLPRCNNQCKLDVTGKVIKNGESCIDEDGVIYQYVSKSCKKMENDGVKIFQKSNNLNSYIDVTGSLDAVSLKKNESIPFFVIYNCKDSICTQSSGYVKYKRSNAKGNGNGNGGVGNGKGNGNKKHMPDANYSFVSCYKQKNTDNTNAYPFVGCIPLNIDNSKDKECTKAKATYNAIVYKNSSKVSKLKVCFSPRVEGPDYRYITINMDNNEDGIFMFINYDTQFPNTLKNRKVLVNVNKNWIVQTNEIEAGVYKNAGISYVDSGVENLTCENDKISSCSVAVVSTSSDDVEDENENEIDDETVSGEIANDSKNTSNENSDKSSDGILRNGNSFYSTLLISFSILLYLMLY